MMKPSRLDDALNAVLVVAALSLLAGLYLDVAGGHPLGRDDTPPGALLVSAPPPSGRQLAQAETETGRAAVHPAALPPPACAGTAAQPGAPASSGAATACQ